MKSYPINLIGLETRRCVVVGGGEVAARKLAGLLAAGARVTVISPEVSSEVGRLTAEGRITLLQRPYESGDLAGAFLVIAATDDSPTNAAVWQEAGRLGCLINAVDDPAHSNFILPAVVRRGEVNLAISTGGASPALARRLREQLETQVGPEYGDLAGLMAEMRPALMREFPPGEARQAAAQRLLESDLLEVVRRDGIETARRRARELLGLAG
jgi:precorrin-2 dehydrogenase/sirohydrochlorin ferrochelatase